MPEKDGSDDKKSTKSVVNKKQKQLMNKEQLDLTSVAESFGGQIVGEPVELDEEPFSLGTLGTVAAIKYGILPALAVGTVGYDSYKKMRGEKGILPDLSGVVKGVYDKIRGVHRSQKINPDVDTTFGDALTKNRRKIKKKFHTKDGIESGTFKYNKDPNNKNNKNDKENKTLSNILKIGGAGAGGSVITNMLKKDQTQKQNKKISNITKTKTKTGKDGKLPSIKFPDPAHIVGRRSNPQ